MSISVIIPNFNGEKILRKNFPKVVEALKSYERGEVEVIIVDDASSDDSEQVIKDFQKEQGTKLKFLKNEKNLGFSSTVNRGVENAEGEIVILLNTDVVPQIGFLDSLVMHFKDEKVFAVGCMDMATKHGRGKGRWERGLLVHSAGDPDKTNTLWVSGGSSAFKKELWYKLGGMDTLYNPFYWEDIDLCYRALKSGYKTVFEKNSVVRHEHEEGAIKKAYSKNYINTISYRNQFIFAWKNSDFNNLFKGALWLPYHLIKGGPLLLQGFFSALVLLPKIIKSRLKASKQFVRSDHEITLENQ